MTTNAIGEHNLERIMLLVAVPYLVLLIDQTLNRSSASLKISDNT